MSTSALRRADDERLDRRSHGPADDQIVVSPEGAAPLRLARMFIREHETDAVGRCTVARWGEEWWRFRDRTGWYERTTTEQMRSDLYPFLDRVVKLVETKRGPVYEELSPTRNTVSNVVDALTASGFARRPLREPPCWLDGEVRFDPRDILVCPNALVHLPTGERMPPTPEFFTIGGVATRFEMSAPRAPEWLAFLRSLWPNDPDSILTLQMIMGYLLTPDTRQQKIFLLVGPKRSGKGTIARVIRALVGSENVAGPSLTSLQTDFGLQPLIGKLVAIVSDARLGPKADQAAIAERLLSISGEDAIDINRKHRDFLTLRLSARLVILSNELPRLTDASGALASRFVVLKTTRSFFGAEDKRLEQRLLDELPAILQWTIEGWHMLRDRGAFPQPSSAREDVRALEELASPILSFVDDCCVLDASREVDVANLFDRWQRWCEKNGRLSAGTIQNFGRDLRAAVPEVELQRRRLADGSRQRTYTHIGLR
jgi:putative DNA primase/helicase